MTFAKLCSVTVLSAALSFAADAGSQIVGVCEALRSTTDHQAVSIRGVLSLSRHGAYLIEGTGDDPCPGWPAHFFTAPSALPLLNGSGYGVRVSDAQVRRTLDVFVRLRKEVATNPTVKPTMTIAGVLIRKRWVLILRYPNGTYHGGGFGPDKDCAALLVVTSTPAGK